ncbi:hypothetical protein [Flocculibacter collagenilyticus]|uniref:hypothetical protein n=1 Tax=Flocculibacter collagenilyticus TaxID=2744479 RepID=UPI0018F6F585|nr:hypothetical protein [Flocculibacter collagenilyticus]
MIHNRRNHHQVDALQRPSLSVAQHYTLNEVEFYGYEGLFTRAVEGQRVVVAMRDDHAITIDESGDVDMAPDLALRR